METDAMVYGKARVRGTDRCTVCRRTYEDVCLDWGMCSGCKMERTTNFVARRRDGHFSLRAVDKARGGDGIEFARLRQEQGRWAVWMEDRDRERVFRTFFDKLQGHRALPLDKALAAAKTAYFGVLQDANGVQ